MSGEHEPRFEDALAELEQLVGRLERGETGLEEALAAWERGEALVRQCLARLDAAQGRIEQLGTPAAGDGPAAVPPTADAPGGESTS